MPFVRSEEEKSIRRHLEQMKDPVRILHFTQDLECRYCPETRQLLEKVASLSDKLDLATYNHRIDRDTAMSYGVDKAPATVLVGKRSQWIRYFGIASRYEFRTLLDDIVMMSRDDSGLSEESRRKLEALNDQVHIQVFVTPECPYCPSAVRLAHQLAMENPLITADMIEVTEFPELADRYGISGVPRTVVNEQGVAVGSLPEAAFIDAVLLAAKGAPVEAASVRK